MDRKKSNKELWITLQIKHQCKFRIFKIYLCLPCIWSGAMESVNQNSVGNRSKQITKEPEGRIREEQTLQNHDLDKALNQREKKSKMATLARIGKWDPLMEEIDPASLQKTGSSCLRLNRRKYPQRKAASPEVSGTFRKVFFFFAGNNLGYTCYESDLLCLSIHGHSCQINCIRILRVDPHISTHFMNKYCA